MGRPIRPKPLELPLGEAIAFLLMVVGGILSGQPDGQILRETISKDVKPGWQWFLALVVPVVVAIVCGVVLLRRQNP